VLCLSKTLALRCKNKFQGSICCGYGAGGVDLNGYDCVMIPGASKVTNAIYTPAPNSICGNKKGLVKVVSGASTTLCSKFFQLN
jgi:hypothetical protein